MLVSTAAGFLLAAPLGPEFPWRQGLIAIVGVLLLSCGASALNQVQERRQDGRMARTAGRPLPSGRLSVTHALCFAALASLPATLLLARAGPGRRLPVTLAASTTVLPPCSAILAVRRGAVSIPGSRAGDVGGRRRAPWDLRPSSSSGIRFSGRCPHFGLCPSLPSDYAAGGSLFTRRGVGALPTILCTRSPYRPCARRAHLRLGGPVVCAARYLLPAGAAFRTSPLPEDPEVLGSSVLELYLLCCSRPGQRAPGTVSARRVAVG